MFSPHQALKRIHQFVGDLVPALPDVPDHAGMQMRPQDLAALAKELYENPQIRYCPHGRPVYSVITKYELDKQFGRIV